MKLSIARTTILMLPKIKYTRPLIWIRSASVTMLFVYIVDLYAYAQTATQLLSAVSDGDIATVRRLLTAHGVSVNATDEVNRTF